MLPSDFVMIIHAHASACLIGQCCGNAKKTLSHG
jgi:hypothetical protein